MLNIYFSNYSLLLLITYILIFVGYKVAKKENILLCFSILVLAVIAYNFDPITAWKINGNYTDLYRYYYDMELFKNSGWNATNLLTNYDAILPVKFFIFLIANTNIYGILPFVSVIITFGLFYLILNKIKKIYSIDEKKIMLTFICFVFLTNFKVLITNIRMPIGTAIFFYILYNDLCLGKKRIVCFFGYIALCFIHSVFLIFFALRVAFAIFKKYGFKIVAIILLCYEFLFSNLINTFSFISSSSIINSFFEKVELYSESSIASNIVDMNLYLLGILKVCLLVYITIIYTKKYKKNSEFTNMFQITMIFNCFTIGSMWNYHLFHRMTNFLIYLICFWYLILKKYEISNKHTHILYGYDIVMLGVVIIHLFYFFLSYQYRVMCF